MQQAPTPSLNSWSVESRNPLTGLCGLQRAFSLRMELRLWSQSPYGAMWFATCGECWGKTPPVGRSQSPYGAMWFATYRQMRTRWSSGPTCRNPLTGLCGLQLSDDETDPRAACGHVAIPLRGYVVCNPPSPSSEWGSWTSRNPLTGLCGLQLCRGKHTLAVGDVVAIPLRGYVVCNEVREGWCYGGWPSQSPYGAMWFATRRPCT